MSANWIEVFNCWATHWASSMWRACWQSTLLILVVWVICHLFTRLPVAIRYWLWWMACLRLLIGLFWVTPVDLPLLPDAVTPLQAAHNYSSQSSSSAGRASDAASSSIGDVSSPPSSQRSATRISIAGVLLAIWLFGIVLWLLALIRQSLLARRLVAQAQPVTDARVLDQAVQLEEVLGLRRLPTILESSAISSPLVVGPIHPVLMLPANIAQHLSAAELQMALAHEMAHVKRRDLWLAQVPALAQILFFFHPLAWMASREWATACEAACDADTLRLTQNSPAQYGQLLFKLATADLNHHVAIGLGVTLDYQILDRRLKMLRHGSLISRRQLRQGFALVGILACIGLVPWRVTARTDPLPQQHQITKLHNRYAVAGEGTLDSRKSEGLVTPKPRSGAGSTRIKETKETSVPVASPVASRNRKKFDDGLRDSARYTRRTRGGVRVNQLRLARASRFTTPPMRRREIGRRENRNPQSPRIGKVQVLNKAKILTRVNKVTLSSVKAQSPTVMRDSSTDKYKRSDSVQPGSRAEEQPVINDGEDARRTYYRAQYRTSNDTARTGPYAPVYSTPDNEGTSAYRVEGQSLNPSPQSSQAYSYGAYR